MARKSGSAGSHVVPEAGRALDRMKYEIAAELGIPVGGGNAAFDSEFAAEPGTPPSPGREPYWGDLPARDAGAVGGRMLKRLVEQAQRSLFS